jgi:2,4-dienoyl-CoA reductase-like NADH-dependent reductase (Old Yellow Enzyme family)
MPIATSKPSTWRSILPRHVFSGPHAHLNLAGWTKKHSDRLTITVRSVTPRKVVLDTTVAVAESELASNLGLLLDMFERNEFDLVAVGRALVANPNWSQKVCTCVEHTLHPCYPGVLARLD